MFSLVEDKYKEKMLLRLIKLIDKRQNFCITALFRDNEKFIYIFRSNF